MSFINLHVHSEYSLLDGCGRMEDFIQRAKEMGQEALAFTDHGTMRGAYHFYKLARDIKPIYGIEFYVCNDHKQKGLTKDYIESKLGKKASKQEIKNLENELGVRRREHITVLAKNNVGLKNLFKLTSISWIDGFYYRPRIDFELLKKYGEGLIVLSGCIQGSIAQLLLQGEKTEAYSLAKLFYGLWGEDFYIEIMPTGVIDLKEPDKINQPKVNPLLFELSKVLSIPLVATIDAHYVRRGDWKSHDLLLCVNTSKTINDPKRWRFSAQDYWLHSRKEVIAEFRVNHPSIPKSAILEAIESTKEIADKCNAQLEVDTGKIYLPAPSETESEFNDLVEICWEGWDKRNVQLRIIKYATKEGINKSQALEIYLERLKKELTQIKRQGVTRYFLLIWDLYNWARRRGIVYGPGRGSAGGCLVAFLLGITDIDPIFHDLLFERFLSPDRTDLGDIDCDFEDRKREEILDYLKSRYGQENVCRISTMTRMKGRLCLRDISRSLAIPRNEVDLVCNSIIIKDDEKDKLILPDAFSSIAVCQEFNNKHPEVLWHAKRLEGQTRTVGLHAAGVLVSSAPLDQLIPLETRSHKGNKVVCSGWDMKGCEAAGLLKVDILGLRTLTVNADCLRAIKERHGREIDLNAIELEDKKVLDNFTAGHFTGIFQYDASSARALAAKVKFEKFRDVVAMIALDRPGTARSGLAQEYIKNKADPSKRISMHPVIDKICEDTYGVLVYQEQVSKLFIELAGYTPGEADLVRKAVGKKLGLDEHKDRFLNGAQAHGLDKNKAKKLIKQIMHFGSYAFNKCVVGETIVYRNSTKKSRCGQITVKELFDAQNSKTPWGRKIRGKKLRIFKMDDDGRIRPGFLKRIYWEGRADVYRVRTKNGREIEATLDHKFLTDKGYLAVGDLSINNSLACMEDKKKPPLKGCQTLRARGKTYKGRGFQNGDNNPAWIDGREKLLFESKAIVKKRAKGMCEKCGKKKIGKDRFEFAHVESFLDCKKDYQAYHSNKNILYLCNPCHKKFDYEKGERKPRWSKGKSVIFDKIIAIEYIGEKDVYDVEMLNSPHNFIANNIVSHNSHSTAYGLTAYRQMWLKTYYPIEFMWALLRHEPDMHRITTLLIEAQRLGIKIVPPTIGKSDKHFKIADNKIVCGLSDLKGVGPAAIEAITNNSSYTDFPTFIKQVEPMAVNKGVVKALAKSGALRKLIPNTKWFLENLDNLWDLKNKQGWDKWFRARSKNDSLDYSLIEKEILASEISPFSNGHPLDPYLPELNSWKVLRWNDLGESLWDYDWVWIRGIISSAKYYRVGEYGGETLSENDKIRRGYGKQFAKLNLSGKNGTARIKIPWDRINTQTRTVVDKGIGTPIAALLVINKVFNSMQARVIWSLREIWEQTVKGEINSVLSIIKNGPKEKGNNDLTDLALGARTKVSGKAMVISVVKKMDKMLNPYGRIGFWGNQGFLEVSCFSDNWKDIGSIYEGEIVEAILEPGKWGWILREIKR